MSSEETDKEKTIEGIGGSEKSNGSSSGGFVKWLYPGAPGNDMSAADAPKDKEPTDEMQAQTSSSSGVTTGGPDSEVASLAELPADDKPKAVSDDLTEKMTASATYLTSVFSSAWNKTAKTANDATATSSSLISSAFNKVAGTGEDNGEKKEGDDKDKPEGEEGNKSAVTASSLFSSAMGSFGFGGNSSNTNNAEKKEGDGENKEPAAADGSAAAGAAFPNFSSAFNSLSKVAVDATQTIKGKVAEVGTTTNMLSEFNREQDSFIRTNKNKGSEPGIAPWVGYQGEDELKAKILSLSEDRRNFVRAPPSGVTFEFEYSSVSPVALSLLQEDPRLQKMRYELVPKKVKEEEFWRNYFYRVSLIKQSFELKDLERDEKISKEKDSKKAPSNKAKKEEDINDDDMSGSVDQDEDFVSDSYQASTSDLAEVDESMKKLGVVGDNAEEWEAELEGELNEFEVVKDGDGGGAGGEDNQEWESQIQEMLDAEEKESK